MDFLNSSDEPDRDRELFFRAQLVFFLLGAIDGHAKNFSVFLTPTGFRLTPLYDIMSIYPALHSRQIEPKEARLSMCVGNSRHYRLREIKWRHWEQTAKACGFSQARLISIRDDLARKVEGLEEWVQKLRPQPNTGLTLPVLRGVREAAQRIF